MRRGLTLTLTHPHPHPHPNAGKEKALLVRRGAGRWLCALATVLVLGGCGAFIVHENPNPTPKPKPKPKPNPNPSSNPNPNPNPKPNHIGAFFVHESMAERRGETSRLTKLVRTPHPPQWLGLGLGLDELPHQAGPPSLGFV